jgi:hypothetical protein
MEAQPVASEPSGELADLRRRAYGPDADIQQDPDAVRRLHELESSLRSGEGVLPAPEGAEPAAIAPEPHDVAAPTVFDSAESAGPPRRLSRRALWAIIAGVGIVCAVAGAAFSASLARHPDATLGPTDHVQIDLEDDWLLSVSQWITTDAQPVQHEAFHRLQVLSVTSKAGTSCLVVSWSDHWSDYSCTPAGIAPVVDFVAYLGGPQPLDDPLPPGSVIRFELNGDVVDVTMREPPQG